MATAADRIVKLIFEGDDRVSKVVSGIEKNIAGFTGKLGDATAPLAGIAEGALKAEAALGALAVGGIALATTEAGKFGDSFNEISTLIDASGGDIAAFRQEIIDYGREASSSYEDINGAVYSAISAGIDYRDALGSLTQAEKLSIAGKAELQDTIVLLAGTLNAYGAGVDQAGKYSDVFFKAVKLGQTTIPELGSSLANVTGIAASGKVPIETLAAAIAAVTAAGVPTAQAVTSLKAAITNIIKPSSEAQKVAEGLGIEFNAAALESKGFEGILQEVYAATGGNVDQMAKLFGSTEALNAVLILAQDSSGKFAGALKEMENASGATEEAYRKMADNFSLINQNLINNVRATMIEFGTKFLDEWKGIAQGVGNVFEGVSIAMDKGALDPVFAFIEKAGAELAAYLEQVAKVLPEALAGVDFDGLLDSIGGLGDSIKGVFDAFFGDIDLTTAEGLGDAIQKIVDSIETLTRASSGVLQGLEPFIAGLGNLVDKANSVDGSTKELVTRFFGFADGINKVVGALEFMAPAMAVLAGSSMINAISNVGSLVAKLPALVGGMSQLGTLGAGAAAYGIGYFAGKLINDYVPGVASGTQELFRMADSLINFTGTQGRANEKLAETDKALEATKERFKAYQDRIKSASDELDEFFANEVPDFKELSDFEIRAGLSVTAEGSDAEEVMKLLNDPKLAVEVGLVTDKQASNPLDEITWTDADGNVQTLSGRGLDLPISTRIVNAAETQSDVDKLAKTTEERLKRIETEADIVQTAMEWEAKVEIAQAEAAAKIMEAAFSSVSSEIASTSSAVTALYDSLTGGGLSGSQRMNLEGSIREQEKMQKEAHEKNMALLDAQVKRTELINKQIERGEAVFKIDAANLQPHLEAIWFEIMKVVQIRGTESSAEFLLGI